MKLAFINGPKDKNVYDSDDYGNDHVKDIYSYPEQRKGLQINFEEPKLITYHKTLLKYKNTYKYFYIFEGSDIDSIKSSIQDYWDLSDIAGYDFD